MSERKSSKKKGRQTTWQVRLTAKSAKVDVNQLLLNGKKEIAIATIRVSKRCVIIYCYAYDIAGEKQQPETQIIVKWVIILWLLHLSCWSKLEKHILCVNGSFGVRWMKLKTQ